MKPELVDAVLQKYGFHDWDAICAAVGHGGLKEGQVVEKLQERYNHFYNRIVSDEQVIEVVEKARVARENAGHERSRETMESKSGIIVEGLNDLAVRFSRCCSPVPGDEIVGFVTRGRGISIHRTDCVNMIHLPEAERNRLIEAEWSDNAREGEGTYPVEIVVYGNSRNGILMDITRVFTEANIYVQSMNVRTTKQDKSTITIGFEIHKVSQLDGLMNKLRQIEGVIDIERSTNG